MPPTPPVAMIAAHGKNRVIGAENAMPWHIPADLKFFREKTWGKPVIMGRKTFQSIGRALAGRVNIVITRNKAFTAPGVITAPTPDHALKQAREKAPDAEEIMIIGGAQIYRQMLDRATRLYLTEINLAPDGDAFFPDYKNTGHWSGTWRESHGTNSTEPAFDFVIYCRTDEGHPKR